ncbi:hypothetical protein ACG02S_01875 [Roseateles sp. DC23W]|uniref:Uncharacterized protein n=1 Tax=Pelomonas dachongensis TaxID=3299029 RepID=A0ABW7EGY9_9BURK
MNRHASATRLLALGAIAATALLTGCASGPSVTQAARVPGEPLVERHAAVDAQRLLNVYQQRGYVLVGSSGFSSARHESEANAVAQGRQIGADLVLLLDARPAYANIPASTRNSPASTFGSNAGGIAQEVGPARTREALSAYSARLAADRGGQRPDLAAAYFVKQREAMPAL